MTEACTEDGIPLGYRLAAGYAGVRKVKSDDFALIVSDRPASAAGVFTRNVVRAAPVDMSAGFLRVSGGVARMIVANAGNANCATANMEAVSAATAAAAAKLAGVPEHQVLLASTGVIGEEFDEGILPRALPRLWDSLDRRQLERCARAIMTTDTAPKHRCRRIETPGGTVRLAGIAKGAGMIMPDMATMLAFVFTDAAVEPEPLAGMLRSAVDRSFNRITVDSDTSTNDTVYLLANGESGVRFEADSAQPLTEALDSLTRDLALDIVRDGEGADRLAEIRVAGARTDADAKTVAMAVANSPLVKTALAGADPNWGRILGAAGKAGVAFDARKASVRINGTEVCAAGIRADFDEPAVQRGMDADDVVIGVDLGGGPGRAVVWTCDFTEDYIHINADYRS